MSVVPSPYSPPAPITHVNDRSPDVEVHRPAAVVDNTFANLVGNQLSVYTGSVVSAARQFSELADRGPSRLLFGLGSVLLVVTLFSKLRLFGGQISDLGSVEFVAMTLTGLALICLGTALRYYQFRESGAETKDVRETGRSLLESTTKKALEMVDRQRSGSDGGL